MFILAICTCHRHLIQYFNLIALLNLSGYCVIILYMDTTQSNKCSCASQWSVSFVDTLWRFKCQQSYFTSDHFSKSIQLMCLSSMVRYLIHLKGHSRGIRPQVLNWGWFHHLSSKLDFLD